MAIPDSGILEVPRTWGRPAWTGLVLAALVSGAPAAAQHGDAADALFVTAGTCMACHNGLVSPDGRDLSFGTRWRASMMANAARDPYWQAAVKRETLDHPDAAAAIQDECSKCHMPMARFEAHAAGGEYASFGNLPWQAGSTPRAHALAADGVSCTVCHQIEPGGLGEEATFTGEFRVDTGTPMGRRAVYGPYDVAPGPSRAMASSGGFRPTAGEHIRESGLCASCHTLFTHARNDDGEVVGELPEQVPFLEWLHSEYRDERSCQGCHMPEVGAGTPISSVLPTPRAGVRRHVFRGGNFFIPRVFNTFRSELAVEALAAELDGLVAATEAFLSSSAAGLAVEDGAIDDGVLGFEVAATNLAGHKLPTAYPSRRAWLHVTVRDADGRTVFESGRL
ncbi:MAG: multiheme c-type cytochrome, partial [Longimicrobiales bacterium]|nr:multiheme c-type cytochrome [Longimicrobiales bacterium]